MERSKGRERFNFLLITGCKCHFQRKESIGLSFNPKIWRESLCTCHPIAKSRRGENVHYLFARWPVVLPFSSFAFSLCPLLDCSIPARLSHLFLPVQLHLAFSSRNFPLSIVLHGTFVFRDMSWLADGFSLSIYIFIRQFDIHFVCSQFHPRARKGKRTRTHRPSVKQSPFPATSIHPQRPSCSTGSLIQATKYTRTPLHRHLPPCRHRQLHHPLRCPLHWHVANLSCLWARERRKKEKERVA